MAPVNRPLEVEGRLDSDAQAARGTADRHRDVGRRKTGLDLEAAERRVGPARRVDVERHGNRDPGRGHVRDEDGRRSPWGARVAGVLGRVVDDEVAVRFGLLCVVEPPVGDVR